MPTETHLPANEPPSPPTLRGRLKEIRDVVRTIGELLDDPEKVTLGEIYQRGAKLLRLLGLVQ